MSKKFIAHGEATVRLTDRATGRVVREVTTRNKINSDYVAEVKNNLFSSTSALTLFLSEYDQSPPDNGLIFPMGRFLGFGKYNAASASVYQGIWNAAQSRINQQENGLTSSTFSWDFTPAQAIGNLRSLFLYWDAAGTHYPALSAPAVDWKGTPRCGFENKLYDTVAKTATEYYVGDYFTKELVLRHKANTLTVTGLAYDLDTHHIFVFDSPDKKIYEYESLDVDMTAANVLAEYPCTSAYFTKGLVRHGNLYFINGNTGATGSFSSFSGTAVYLHCFSYATDSAVLLDTMTCAEMGIPMIGISVTATFLDDYLVYYYTTSSAGYCAPVLRLIGDTPRVGMTGLYISNTAHTIQRPSADTQILLAGNPATATINATVPMAVSHLLLPEALVKDDAHGLSVSYTIFIQE